MRAQVAAAWLATTAANGARRCGRPGGAQVRGL